VLTQTGWIDAEDGGSLELEPGTIYQLLNIYLILNFIPHYYLLRAHKQLLICPCPFILDFFSKYVDESSI